MPHSPQSDAPQSLAADSRPVKVFVATVSALCGLVLGVAIMWLGPVEYRNHVIGELGQKFIQATAQRGQEKAP